MLFITFFYAQLFIYPRVDGMPMTFQCHEYRKIVQLEGTLG